MISIIIPTLNEEKHLPLLLEQIKNQDFNDYEIIVADAGSKDRTREIAVKYDCKIIKGGLPAKGRNQGAKIAQGNIFLFFDADIIIPLGFLNIALREFHERNLGIAVFPVLPQGGMIDRAAYGLYNLWNRFFKSYAAHCLLVRRDIFEKVFGFDEEITIAEDHYFAEQASKFGKAGFIKTEPVLTSVRRFEKDGRFRTYLKFIIVGIYMFFFGPFKSDIFKYRFNYNSCKKKTRC